jgi:hypothetical protein
MARAFVATRGYENYAVAIFGAPGDANWGWKIAGDHAAANFTISDGRIGFTPTFLGSSPMEVQSRRYAGLMALSNEGQRGIDLMQSLDSDQQTKATIAGEAADDVFEGPGRRQSLENYEGLLVSNLTKQQMHLLQRLIAEFAHNANHDHMVIRDPSNDYGEDWLGKHYEEHHPNMEDTMENARRRAASLNAGVKE